MTSRGGLYFKPGLRYSECAGLFFFDCQGNIIGKEKVEFEAALFPAARLGQSRNPKFLGEIAVKPARLKKHASRKTGNISRGSSYHQRDTTIIVDEQGNPCGRR